MRNRNENGAFFPVMARQPTFPDGIGASNLDPGPAWKGIAARLALVALALAAALAGLLGGGPTPDRRGHGNGASLAVHVPNPIRNGMFAEWRVEIAARRPVGDAVIAIPANLWRDMTINTLMPAATEEEYKDGEFRFHFGPLEPGDTLLFKIDGQLNPARFSRQRGDIRLLDGERELARVPVDVKVIY